MAEEIETDVIVVGAGSGGSTVTCRLVDAGLDVLLLESGPKDVEPAIHDPARSFKVLGGSSSVNGMIYARGDRVDYDAWAYLGNAGWTYDDVLPLFRRSEDFDRGADAFHGAGG